jgi:hypothetical protein
VPSSAVISSAINKLHGPFEKNYPTRSHVITSQKKSAEGTLMVLGSKLFFVDVDSAVGYLHYAVVGCVADVSEEHTA